LAGRAGAGLKLRARLALAKTAITSDAVYLKADPTDHLSTVGDVRATLMPAYGAIWKPFCRKARRRMLPPVPAWALAPSQPLGDSLAKQSSFGTPNPS